MPAAVQGRAQEPGMQVSVAERSDSQEMVLSMSQVWYSGCQSSNSGRFSKHVVRQALVGSRCHTQLAHSIRLFTLRHRRCYTQH